MYLRNLFLLLLSSCAAAQTISIVSGNGQIVNYFSGQNSQPIVFQLTSNGVAVPNATITFQNSNGSAENSLSASSAVTDGSGKVTVFFHSPFMTATYTTYELVAKYAGASIVFYETALEIPPGSATLQSPSTSVLNPLTAVAGQPSQAIVVAINASFGAGVPNVAVRVVVNQTAAPAGTITQKAVCLEGKANPEGNVFTGADSMATCTPVFTYPNAALNPAYDSRSFNILVGNAFSFGPFSYNITPMPLGISGPQGTILLTGQPSTLAVSASGGVAPYSFSLTNTSNLLPAGLTLESNGQIVGTTNVPGKYTFTAQVTDKTGATKVASSPFTLAVSGGPFNISPPTVGDPVVGIPYSQSIMVNGGVPPYTVSVSGLPSGLSMAFNPATDSITISGTAMAASNTLVAFLVVDALGNSTVIPLTGFQSVNPLTLQGNPQLVNAGSAYTLTMKPSGGLAPYTFTATGLPVGLQINQATGVISGTPTVAGANSVSVTVTDSIGESVKAPFFIDVSGGPIGIPGSPTLPAAQAGVAYEAPVTVTGGVPPYTVSIGAAVPGATLQVLGGTVLTLSGTFTLSGSQTVTITVTDQIGTSQNVNVIVPVAPVFPAGGVTNSATFQVGGIAPGEIITIFGSGLGPNPGVGPKVLPNGFLSANVAGTKVSIGGYPAPIFYAGSTQLNVVVPFEVQPGTSTQITVTSNGQTSAPISANVEIASPGIFIIGSGPGNNQGAVLNQDLSVNGPKNPAKRGDIIVVYATGGGQLSAALADGQLTTSSLVYVANAGLTIGGQTAVLAYAGLAPGYAGLLQFNATVPNTVVPGDAVPLVLSIAGASSSGQIATVAIQ